MLFAPPWIESEPFLDAGRPSALGPRRALDAGELEQWLGISRSPPPTWRELASALGPSIDVLAGDASARLARTLRFALAVLRDVFPDDVGVRVWLYTPNPGNRDRRPLDLILSGRIDLLERLAVGEWNRLVAARRPTTL